MDAAAPADPAATAARSPPSLMAVLRDLWKELPELLNDRVELLSLELQRAGAALVEVVVLIVAAAILGVTAWLVLWAAIVWALASAGLHLALALAVALMINVAAAYWAAMRARAALPKLRLPATRRHLMITPSPTPHATTRNPTPDESPELRERTVS
jgi:uncharacterized membrane protein YqjE